MKNYADVIKAYDEGRYWQTEIRKVSGSCPPQAHFDLSYTGGQPMPNYYASEPLVMMALNGNKGIYKGIDTTSKKYIHKLCFSTFVSNMTTPIISILDYIAYVPFVDLDSTDEQFVENIPLPRFTDGQGLRLMAILQGSGTGLPNLTIRYINQDGIESTTTTLVTTQYTAGSLMHSIPSNNAGRAWINLAKGDTGIRSIVSVKSSLATGAICALVIVKPICEITVAEYLTPIEIDFLAYKTRLPEIHRDAYLNMILFNNNTASYLTPNIVGYINFIWE